MITEFTGKYFDGQSSRPLEVIVKLMIHQMQIFNPDGSIIDVWDVSEITNSDFSNSKACSFTYGTFPKKSLTIEDPDAFNSINTLYKGKLNKSLYLRILKGDKTKILLYGVFSLISILIIYIFVIAPFLATKIVELVPEDQEVAIGNKMWESIKSIIKVDEEKSELLNDFYIELGYNSAYPVELVYVDEPIVNAFAIPGGKIIVYDGLVKKMYDWKELAGLLAHELAHVENRHSLKSLARSLSIYIAISVITSDLSGISATMIDNALKIKELSNSRSYEQEADNVGFEYMVTHKIDPKGMKELFETLESEEKSIFSDNNKKILKYLSTHPLTEERIKNINFKIQNLHGGSFGENKFAKDIFNKILQD